MVPTFVPAPVHQKKANSAGSSHCDYDDGGVGDDGDVGDAGDDGDDGDDSDVGDDGDVGGDGGVGGVGCLLSWAGWELVGMLKGDYCKGILVYIAKNSSLTHVKRPSSGGWEWVGRDGWW